MITTLVQLAGERQRVLGSKYFLPDGTNVATKRNFYLDIAEELADIWVIANEAMKRMDIDPWCRSYLRQIMRTVEDCGNDALEFAERYGHDDIPVDRVLPTETN